MKKLLHLLTVATAPVLALTLATPTQAAIQARTQKSDVFKYAPLSKYEQKHNGKALSLNKLAKKANSKMHKIADESNFVAQLPSSYAVGYLDGPDGKTWYYTQDIKYTEEVIDSVYDITENYITGYSFTIYNSSYEKVGEFSDEVAPDSTETRISAIELGACVTQKFFNRDNNYEVMVMIAANTPQYVNHYYTRVYSLGSETEGPVATFDDYYSDAVNAGSYSEKYYITFVHEGNDLGANVDYAKDVDYADTDTVYSIKNTVYAPASWSSDGATVLKTFNLPYDLVEGSGGLPFLSAAHNSSAYFASIRYEKPFFANPGVSIDYETGEMNRDTTPTKDNSLKIDVYKTTYNSIDSLTTVTIPMDIISEDGTNNLFYELGYLNYNDDMSFDTWTDDDNPSFIVTIEDYSTGQDESTYAFKVYDINGKKIADIADNVSSMVDMSDINGFEHQQGFYKVVDNEEIFEFVDMPSCNVASTFKVATTDNSLTASADRYPVGDSYQYAFSLSTGINNDDNSNTDHYISWYDAKGNFLRNDIISLGANIAQALPYVKTSVLNPYLFNTDDEREYMFLLKKYVSSSSTETSESLEILNTKGNVIARLGNDSTLGSLRNIVLVDADSNPSLWFTYYNDDTDKYTSTFMTLPLTKFEAGGDGSAENPFLISTIGDLQQIRGNLTANYKLAKDLNGAYMTFSPIAGEFTGTLDGAGHIIYNFTLNSDEYYNAIFEQVSEGAVIKDLNFYDVNVVLNSNNDVSGLVAAESRGNGTSAPTFSNIHVNNYNASLGDDTTGSFGGLVGKLYLGSTLSNSSISNANFDLNSSNVGGLASETRTGSTITGCAFHGYIAGDTNVGGILAQATTGDETITNNHVIATIEGGNTIGGIVGDAARAKIANNYVSGSISASTNNKWGAGARVGGIVGSLDEDWYSSTTPIVTNNVVDLTSIAYPAYSNQNGSEPEWTNQGTTAHRIVGYTSYNAEPGKDAMPADAGIINNYAVSTLARVDSNIEAGVNTTEGADITAEGLTQDFFTTQGFALGTTAEQPWAFTEKGLYLYYEDVTKSGVNDIVATPSTTLQGDGKTFTAEGCTLNVYNLYGVKVAESADSVSTLTLTPGVYVVTATQNGTIKATAKFVIK